MADDYVQVPTDDTGKKLQTVKNTVGANDVHAECVHLVDVVGAELEKAEDAVHSSGDKGIPVLGVRQDDVDTITDATGDYSSLKVNKHGHLYSDVAPFHIIDQCNVTAGWTALNNDTLNVTTDLNHVCGTASLEFDKVDGAANTVFGCIQKTLTSVKLGPYTRGGGFLLWSLYISTVADIAYAFIRLGTDNANYNEWRIDDDQLTAEWNHIRMPVNSPTFAGSTGNGWNPSAVTYVAVGVAFDAQDDTLADILVDKIQICSGLQTSADITAQVTSEVSSPNVIVRDWGAAVDTNVGNASNGTLRVTVATDDVNLASIESSVETQGALDHGSNLDVDTAAEQITATSYAAKRGVCFKADKDNTGILYLGNSDVTDGDTEATDGLPLEAGESVTLPVNNPNLVYAIASVANQKIYWIAV